MIALNFDSTIGHFVNGLINDDGGVRFFHDFVDLISSGADEERNHAFRYKNDDGEGFSFNFFKHLVDVTEKSFTALVLALHVFIIDLIKLK